MEKRAKTETMILENIEKRWSPRAFDPSKTISKEQLLRLLNAARWAASSYNEQPWRFIIGIKGEGDSWDKLFSCLGEFNQQWAKNAPLLMLACGKKNFSKNQKPNHHYAYDVGQAVATLAIQATGDGLYLHQMAGFSPQQAKETFSIPEEFEAITAIAVGYQGKEEELPEKLQEQEEAPRSRKPLEEICYINEWAHSFL